MDPIRNHVIRAETPRTSSKNKETRITKIFAECAPFSEKAQSLQGRVSIPKEVTKRGQKLAKQLFSRFGN